MVFTARCGNLSTISMCKGSLQGKNAWFLECIGMVLITFGEKVFRQGTLFLLILSACQCGHKSKCVFILLALPSGSVALEYLGKSSLCIAGRGTMGEK